MRSSVAALIGLGFVAFSSNATADSPAAYKRCAACHLETGEGVPGAFPPLTDRLGPLTGTEAGRDYLTLVIEAGLMGAIDVDGVTYRGMMPPQRGGLDDAEKAEILNHIIDKFNAGTAPASWEAFTADEIAAVKDRHGKINARKVHELRAAAFETGE